jgi:hypothetical protein
MADSVEPTHVVASALTIVDSRGRRRATIDVIDGLRMPSFRLYDSNGCERIVIGLTENDIPQFAMLREDGKPILGMGVDGIGNTGIEICNAAGVPIITVQVSVAGDGDVRIYDSQGGGIVSIRDRE